MYILIKKRKWKFILIAMLICIMILWSKQSLITYANAEIYNISGLKYEFEKDNQYEISNMLKKSDIISGTDLGRFSVSGDIKKITYENGINAYEVKSGNVCFNYKLGEKLVGAKNIEWHLYDDKTKKIDGEELETKILKGAILLQTSLDGENWTTDKVITNFADDKEYKDDFYISKKIQQINGCYYKVIVAYAEKKQIGDKKVFNIAFGKENEYKKVAEVYTFYLIDSFENSDRSVTSVTIPKKNLGSIINTGHNNGYSGNETIDNKDPHYGWEIGQFFVNGYTRETKDSITGHPIFLKNLGDRVTLWFNLKQDIKKLNGNNKLSIANDDNGYDQYFQIKKTNLRRGALIVRYTDSEGVKHEPVIYTDYLAANTKTAANTKVELFEEGDYEVALDYEIVNKEPILDSYTNYRIFLTFSIRNGNCMVYPFDISTGSELQDNSITENGFKLDMAKSKYLTIDVKRMAVTEGVNGISEDIRFNRPAKDGEQYKEEGIYVFSVKNLYTEESTNKTIYVGKSPFLRAMAVNGMQLDDLKNKIAEGYKIEENGKLVATDNKEKIEESISAEDKKEQENVNADILSSGNSSFSKEIITVHKKDNALMLGNIPIIAGGIVIVAICIFTIKRKKK